MAEDASVGEVEPEAAALPEPPELGGFRRIGEIISIATIVVDAIGNDGEAGEEVEEFGVVYGGLLSPGFVAPVR